MLAAASNSSMEPSLSCIRLSLYVISDIRSHDMASDIYHVVCTSIPHDHVVMDLSPCGMAF